VSAPRVLQIVLSLDPGGTERLVLELAARLHHAIPTAVCCLDHAGAWAGELERQGIRVTALNRTSGFRPTLGRAVAEAARAHGATVAHAHHYSPFVYGALSRLTGSDVKVVFTEHGRLSDRGPSSKRRMVNSVLRRLASRVYTVSEDVRRHLVAEGFRPADVGVIYNGISVGPRPSPEQRAAVRRELGAGDDVTVLATIARLDPVKDLATMIDAVASLGRSTSSKLVIVGDGDERAALERRVDAAGLRDRVRFFGHRDDARRWLAGCDLYLNSSISEGVSLTILEAMAAALPIVATGVGGTPEVVTSDCGRLVPSRNSAALAAAIEELSNDPSLRAAMSEASRRRVEAHFTLERMVSEYRRVYEELSGA
jgi:glycosyltransferase involved in cell wall biosynthesis